MTAEAAVPTPRVAVLVPCYNEELSVAQVISDFQASLPGADIYVYDNNSKDRTVEVATVAGAIVRRERRQGKGAVVRRMFADIEADIYIMVDGDATYDASVAPDLIRELCAGPYDMVNVARIAAADNAYRAGHAFGNKLLTGLVQRIFGVVTSDMLSGYKAFSRRYVKSFPVMSRGFEIETELAIHALTLKLPSSEIAAPYKERPPGSVSKLSTYSDGFRILRMIGVLMKEERPLLFFGICAAAFALLSLILGTPILITFLETGLVPRFPTAILATGLMISAMLSLSCGLILDSVTRGRRETKLLQYLQLIGPPSRSQR